MNTEIVVKDEQLTFSIEDDDFYKANVDVHYTFFNPLSKNITTQVAFPYSGHSSANPFQVTVDGKNLEPQSLVRIEDRKRYERFLQTFAAEKTIMVDPVTGDINDDWGHDGSYDVQLVVFPLTFEALQEKDVRIHYQQMAGTDNVLYMNPVKLYQYYLLPASAWKMFQHLHVTIITPQDVFFAANLPFEQMAGADQKNRWEGDFPSLPKVNLAFSIMTREGLLWNIASREFYDSIVLLLITLIGAVITIFLAIQFHRTKKWWLHWLIGPIATSAAVTAAVIQFILLLIFAVPIFSRSTWIGSYGIIATFFLTIFFGGSFYVITSIVIHILAKMKQKNA
ncbi:hypothetical protein ACTID9_26205 [Brevibacillus fluminis]|uniref:hypothetical protein n=1 Tax=Brevibacillus fluminis TaxID=511487 RepID=UPI003F88A57F